MYSHVSKCKNNTIKLEKEIKEERDQGERAYPH
jgi:hypothetical protein